MSRTVEQVVEGTILLVLVFLVVSNAFGVTSLIRAVGSFYVEGVKTLQGR